MAHGRGRFQKKIETVHWTVGAPVNVVSLASAAIEAVNVFAAQHLPETLLRIRGEWVSSLVGALTDAGAARLVAGMILVPEGTGTTVLWSPFIDGDAPWIWWDVMNLVHREPVVDVISTELSGARRVIDSKAMRKNRNRELQFVVENLDPGALTGAAADVLAQIRSLSGS